VDPASIQQLTVRSPGSPADDIRIFYKLWEHVLTLFAHFTWSLSWFPPVLYRSPSLRALPACHPRYSSESSSPYSSVSVSLPIAVALHTVQTHHCPLALSLLALSSSVLERQDHHFRSSSVPVSSTPLSMPTPLHRSVTVGRSSSHECGSRGPCAS
jgi:hypothetical protein